MQIGLDRVKAPHARAPYQAGAAGVRQSVEAVVAAALQGMHDPDVRGWVVDTLAAAGCDGRSNKCSVRDIAQAILDAVRKQTVYVDDPANTEWVQAPHVTLCLRDVCIRGGDCDDLTALVLAALLSAGLAAFAVKQSFHSGQDHILVGVLDESRNKLYVDAANTTAPVYSGSKATSEVWIDPFEKAPGNLGAAPQIVTLGSAPRDVVNVGGVWQERRYGKLWVHDGAGWRESNRVGLGAGYTSPGDVLAFRETWNDYVLGVVKAAKACGSLWAANDPTINLKQFATPPDATTIKLWSDQESLNGDTLLAQWNKWANTPDWQVVAGAQEILRDQNDTVQRAGQVFGPQITRDCPSITLPTPPGFDLQAQTIGRLEGAGIVAHGLLQLMGIGASGALETYGAIGQQISRTVDKVVDYTPILVTGVVVVAAAYVASLTIPLLKAKRAA